MPFRIIRSDITKVAADVIVNTANPRPVVGGGTDSAVYRAAGEKKLLAERKKLGDIARGDAKVTPAFGLSAKYIIHTVGPVWEGGSRGERDILRSCYARSLALAAELDAESVAFPLIAAGVYGFPKDEALSIALSEISGFLMTHDMEVILAVFDRTAFELSGRLVGEIDEYIDEHGVGLAQKEEYAPTEYAANAEPSPPATRRRAFGGISELLGRGRRSDSAALPSAESKAEADPKPRPAPEESMDECAYEEETLFDAAPAPAAAPRFSMAMSSVSDMEGKSLDDVLSEVGETFRQRLFRLIDESGMDDVTVYKRANIDRKVFSRIRCKEDYKPTKRTAVAFAIALRLDMPQMLDLLSRAEIALSPGNKFDLIITYFVANGVYDIFEINAALFRYGQPILGE